MPSNRRAKDREADHQRWADRQAVTADVLRETVEAAGARAAEISEWLDSSFLPDDPDSVFGAPPKPTPLVTSDLRTHPGVDDEAPVTKGAAAAQPEQVPSASGT